MGNWMKVLQHSMSQHNTVADLGGVPRVPWNPPFGFSCDRKLWKPGLQQNPTIQTVTTNKTILIPHDITV